MRTAKLGASDLGLTLQAEVGLVSGHAEHPLNARLGPVYSSQADLGFLLSWVYEYPQRSPRMDVYKHLGAQASGYFG